MGEQGKGVIDGDILNIDFSQVEAFGNSNFLNTPGEYELNVREVKIDTDEKDGNTRTFIQFSFAVADGICEGQFINERVYMPAAAGKLKQIMEVLGYDVTVQHNVRNLIASDAFLGKPVKVTVTNSPNPTDPSKVRTSISAWEKSARLSAAGTVGAGLPGTGAGLPGGAPAGGGLPGMPPV